MEWRWVVGFEGMYQVSSEGSIRGVDRINTRGYRVKGRARKCVPGNDMGYLKVMLCQGSKGSSLWVHRLVLEAFKGPPPPGTECRHLNGNPLDNRVENLQWGSRLVNIRDKITHGTQIAGWQVPTAKFGRESTAEALGLRAAGLSYSQIALNIGCSASKAWALVNRPLGFQRLAPCLLTGEKVCSAE